MTNATCLSLDKGVILDFLLQFKDNATDASLR